MQPNVNIVLKAISFAAQRHDHIYRLDKRTPYVSHPFRVMFTLIYEFRVSAAEEDILAAAAAHDVIEDTSSDYDTIVRVLGENVAKIVAAVTKNKLLPDSEMTEDYFNRIRACGYPAIILKLADTLDNLRDCGNDSKMRMKTLDKARKLIEFVKGWMPRLKEDWIGRPIYERVANAASILAIEVDLVSGSACCRECGVDTGKVFHKMDCSLGRAEAMIFRSHTQAALPDKP
jgi:hypothetical protein